MDTKKSSRFYKQLDDGDVECVLCPKYCHLRENQNGACRVRGNESGVLVNKNYGLTTYMVIEPIETNGIFHFFPGEKALSLGSVGCNLSCDFCQAWQYSQTGTSGSGYFEINSSEDIIARAKEFGVSVLAWTFNDPMSSFEYVMDTSKMAKSEGIISIFKSNHYVNEIPLRELAESIDVFSVSVKSINPDFYKSICHGEIDPVLRNAVLLKKLGKHVEICNLVIPTKNDSDDELYQLSRWVIDNLGSETPLHFARFHPDYKMLDLERTPVERIARARTIAKETGLKYVYSGNIFQDEGLDTRCTSCDDLLVSRIGEKTTVVNTDPTNCDDCHTPHNLVLNLEETVEASADLERKKLCVEQQWIEDDIWSAHLQLQNSTDEDESVAMQHHFNDGTSKWEVFIAPSRTNIRYSLSKLSPTHNHTSVYSFGDTIIKLFRNLDRAYYASEDEQKT